MKESSPRVLAIAPLLKSEFDPCFPYHLAVQRAVSDLGWHYCLAAPNTSSSVSPWPSSWSKCLEMSERPSRLRAVSKFQSQYSFHKSLKQFLQDHYAEGAPNIIFLEKFTLRQLRLLAYTLLRFSKGFSLWLTFRKEPTSLRGGAVAYRRWIRLLSWVLGSKNVHILVDTEALAQAWRLWLNVPVTVIPVMSIDQTHPGAAPHTRESDRVMCWWPCRPQRNKGEGVLQQLLDSNDPSASKLKFVFASSTPLRLPVDSERYHILPAQLSRKDYHSWMVSSDIILLPYDAMSYAKSSSRAFVEAVILGSIPVVTAGTWAANELHKHNLSELAIDWQSSSAINRILEISQSQEVKTKLQSMRERYQQVHSVSSFTQTVLQLQSQK